MRSSPHELEMRRLAKMRKRLLDQVSAIKRRILLFGHNSEDIDQEIKEIKEALPVLRRNAETLPEGELLTLTRDRIGALDQRLAVLQKRAPNYSMATLESMKKTQALLEQVAEGYAQQMKEKEKNYYAALKKSAAARGNKG